MAGKVGSGLVAALKTATVAIGAASTAAGAFAKISLEGFGEYEQLVGGVETLFGAGGKSIEEYAESVSKSVDDVTIEYAALMEAQDKVMASANDAYKTAGLSANEYMETVTSFAASLVSSLGGQTDIAADVADQAITDMADNANKMGSAIDSIQNAYQGFAKQNYTMLDNLKLGYGGTKEEMERLLADAEELSGIKYDISSFADIVDAIHVIQTEMGITGTTAEEASTTIQGSVASAKAAWQNLVTGIADENADLDTLIGNFVDSVDTAGENIIPRVEQILTGMGTAIQKIAPIIGEQLPPLVEAVLPSIISAGGELLAGLLAGIISALPAIAGTAPQIFEAITTSFSENWPTIQAAGGQLLDMLWNGLTENLPTTIGTASEIITSLVSGIVEALPNIASSAVEIIATLADGISSQLPELVPVAVDAILQLTDALTAPDSLDNMVDSAIQLITALADGIINAMPTLIAKAPVIVANLVSAIVSNLPKLLEAAAQIVGKLATGIIDNLPQIGKAAAKIVMWVVTGIDDLREKILEVGKNIVSGVFSGIQEKADWLREKVTGFFSGIVDGVKNFLGIHSPSTVFAEIGNFMMQGLSIGMENGKGSIMKTAADIIGEVKSRFDQVSNFFGLKSDVSNLEYQLWERTAGKNASDVEKYAKKLQMLSVQQEGQTSVVEAAEAAYQAVVEQYGAASAESYNYQKALLQEKITLQDLLDEIERVSTAKAKMDAVTNWDGTVEGWLGGLRGQEFVEAARQYQDQWMESIRSGNAVRQVQFSDSAMGVVSATAINASGNGKAPVINLRAQMVTADGKVLAEYLADDLTQYMDANGTPIVNPIT